MLGAQALRTKQKVEQREKERRQRERIRTVQLQRERILKAAKEDEAAFLKKVADLQIDSPKQMVELAAEQPTKKQRHSIHVSHIENAKMLPLCKEDSAESTEQNVNRRRSVGSRASGTGSKLSKFFDLMRPSSSHRSEKTKTNRRMSTFT